MVFRDNFEGIKLDDSKWLTAPPWGRGVNYNGERSFYRQENVKVEGGTLRLTASKALSGPLPYDSGMVCTFGRFAFKYGSVDVRARLPQGRGLWPAIWLLPASGAWPPEIDVMEYLGHDPSRVYGTVHWEHKQRAREKGAHRFSVAEAYGRFDDRQFHDFGVEWTETQIVWTCDGKVYETHPNMIHEPMYLLINLAVGGEWGGYPDDKTVFPATFEIERVRIKPERAN